MKQDNLIWIDLEMTGLDFENDVIIEIATIVTDPYLEVLEEGPSLVIHQSDEILNSMDEWCTRQHTSSGLVDDVKKSTVTMAQAEQETLAFLKKWTKKKTSPLCGNSICTDRRFLTKDMPELDNYLHYRHIDVSTVKELAKRWSPELVIDKKDKPHKALDDIKASIDEMKHYRDCFFNLKQ